MRIKWRVAASSTSVVAAGVAVALMATAGSSGNASGPVEAPRVTAVARQAAAIQVPSTKESVLKFKNVLERFAQDHKSAPAEVKAGAVARVKDQLNSGKLAIHVPEGAKLAVGDARAAVGPEGTILAIPLRGAGLEAASGLTAQIGKDGALRATEAQFRSTGPHSGEMTTWSDGALAQHVSATDDGASSAPTTSPVPKVTSIGYIRQANWFDDYVNHLKSCLGDASPPGWLIGVLALPCAAAGPACAAATSLYYGNAVLTCLGM